MYRSTHCLSITCTLHALILHTVQYTRRSTYSSTALSCWRWWQKDCIMVVLHILTKICLYIHYTNSFRRYVWLFSSIDYRINSGIAGWKVHCRKSWRISSSPSDISELFHECEITNISEKFSPLYLLMPFQKYFAFFRAPTFRNILWKIPRFFLKIIGWYRIVPFLKYLGVWLV